MQEIIRTKTYLFVSDLAQKHHLLVSKKAMMYHWNLLTIAIFYGLPVIQLVVTYQQVGRGGESGLSVNHPRPPYLPKQELVIGMC